MAAPHPDPLLLFGATGDHAYKKIFPALQAMVRRGHLAVPVIGVAKGVNMQGWSFGDSIPARPLHVRQGDTVHFTLVNNSTMGHGIAQIFAAAGLSVRCYDEHAAARGTLLDRVRENLQRMAAAAPGTVRLTMLTTKMATSALSTVRRTRGSVTRSDTARRVRTQVAPRASPSAHTTRRRRRREATIQNQTSQAIIVRM